MRFSVISPPTTLRAGGLDGEDHRFQTGAVVDPGLGRQQGFLLVLIQFAAKMRQLVADLAHILHVAAEHALGFEGTFEFGPVLIRLDDLHVFRQSQVIHRFTQRILKPGIVLKGIVERCIDRILRKSIADVFAQFRFDLLHHDQVFRQVTEVIGRVEIGHDADRLIVILHHDGKSRFQQLDGIEQVLLERISSKLPAGSDPP